VAGTVERVNPRVGLGVNFIKECPNGIERSSISRGLTVYKIVYSGFLAGWKILVSY
jgi:hypothetical protein